MATRSHLPVLALALTLLGAGCISSKPCESGGDVTWEPPIAGDRHCQQRLHPKSHRWVNHGQFVQFDAQGRKRVEGMYKFGEKEGTWVQYNEQGKKIKEKYFEGGVEKSVLPEEAAKARREREASEGPQRPPETVPPDPGVREATESAE
ncbi:MAG TPA: hypothetical protein VL588_00765 [Bdellovibrionota bacterium]|nr:hypothetical protein [Bdellovibrionota bacterium]